MEPGAGGRASLQTDAVFVYGALRSGTTMFRLMLEAHEAISNPGESDFLFDYLSPDAHHATGWVYDRDALEADRIFRAKKLHLPSEMHGLDLLREMLDQLAAKKPGVLTLNIHRNVDRLITVMPDARLLHILRDPRDVARSSIGMGWAGTLYHGVDHWIGTEMAWDRVAGLLGPGQVFELKYEDLFSDIEGSLQRVCLFLGVSYSPSMLEYHKATTYGPPDASLAEQWRRLSSPREIAQVESKAGEMMQRRGYPPSGTYRRPGVLEATHLSIANKIGVWRFGIRRVGPGLFLQEKVARRLGMSAWHRRLQQRIQEIQMQFLK